MKSISLISSTESGLANGTPHSSSKESCASTEPKKQLEFDLHFEAVKTRKCADSVAVAMAMDIRGIMIMVKQMDKETFPAKTTTSRIMFGNCMSENLEV